MKYLNLCLIIIVLCACSLDIPLEDEISGNDAIDTPEAAKEFLNAAYYNYSKELVSYSFLSDDFMPTYLMNKNNSTKKLYYWDAVEISYLAKSIWESHYHTIIQINSLLASKPYMILLNEDDQTSWETTLGSAYALKAMTYLELLQLFNDLSNKLGIILKNKIELEQLPRSSTNACISEIEHLLDNALELLEDKDASTHYLDYNSTLMLYARLKLWEENYEAAYDWVGKVLENKKLADGAINDNGYSSLWANESCNEKLFAFNIFTHPLGIYREDDNIGDEFCVSPLIMFEDNDIRAKYTILPHRMNVNGGDPTLRPLLGKYRTSYDDISPLDMNYLRVAEAYFIRAECLARKGEDKEAIKLLNELLQTRGATPLPEKLLAGTDLIKLILDEKQKEFVGEGLRYFDLKRMAYPINRLEVDKAEISKIISSNDFRRTLPIPDSELRQNKSAKQNPGWDDIIRIIN